jgi:hypothetical protein
MDKIELFKTLNSFKGKGEAYKYFGLSGNSDSIKKLTEIANSIGFDLNCYNERRKPVKKFCLNCGKELKNKQNFAQGHVPQL